MRLVICLCFILLFQATHAQKFKSTESRIGFFSEAPLENIHAVNEGASSVMDLQSGNIVFSVPMKSFIFPKSLMQEHFNENYLETDKYPKAIFSGVMNVKDLKLGKNSIIVDGEMNLHGVKKNVQVTGTMTRGENSILAHAEFTVLLVDYKIKIPKAVFYNIAEEIAITVDFTYEPF